MAFDAYLKIEGIPGESKDERHADWIQIKTYSIGVNQISTEAGDAGGGPAGRADFHELEITKDIDIASPALSQACSKGTHIKEVKLELWRAGGDGPVKFMEYKLDQCTVVSVRSSGSSSLQAPLPVETVTFNYAQIVWTYIQQIRADGSGGGPVVLGWDLEKNSPI